MFLFKNWVIIIRFLINVQVQGHHPHQRSPPNSRLAARIAVSHLISRCSYLGSWLSDLSLRAVVLRHYFPTPSWASLARPAPSINLYIKCCSGCTIRMLPMSKLAKPSLSEKKNRLRSPSSSFARRSYEFTVATSSGLILQSCLIMALSLCWKH